MNSENPADCEPEMECEVKSEMCQIISSSDFMESTDKLKSTSETRFKHNAGSWKFESVGGFFLATEDVSKLSLRKQEQVLIRDLIYAFSGVPSSHIQPEISLDEIPYLTTEHIDKVHFKIDERFTGAFRTLANELLPLIGYYISVQSFIEETSLTRNCSRFLGNALQKDMQQYFEFQATLETQLNEQKLNLRQLVQQVRPWLPTMQSYASLTSRVRRLEPNSAQLLSLIDEQQQHFKSERLRQLITDISRYYMTMVQLWTQKGIIYDVRGEFFIEDTSANAMSSTLLSPKQCCHAYWAQRYRLHVDRLPTFLEPLAERILLAGKYLNVLRQCNVHMNLMQETLIYVPKEMEEAPHEQLIRSSYQLPARKLLEVLVQEQLAEHLQNLQDYFLLQERNFIDALLAKCAQQLEQNVDNLQPEKLQRITQDALQLSSNPHKHLLRCQLMDCDVATQLGNRLKQKLITREASSEMDTPSSQLSEQLTLCGYEAFTLRYEPKWPISLVIHEAPLEQLQLLHRVLFYLRYVQHQFQSACHAGVIPNLRASELRRRMIECIEQLEQHMIMDVVQPRWQKLLLVVQQAQLVDEVLQHFQSTLDQCLLLCLLCEPVIFVRSLFILGQQCLNYSSFMEQQATSADFDAGVLEYEEQFNSQLSDILDLITDLARPGSNCGNEERASCKQLVQRLESIGKDLR
ncbi:GH16605 [Drosophila grimshawi]|uniref:Gamma-tubulin complex component n=1 Tax=Drosophila grimshawi TaxID=7222 RepID=B4J274_DROGR|nr:GH16605 [Drosophila grimshawi]